MPADANNPTPNDSPDCPDEWLSAYVDGELSEAEHAAVEARLATDPAAQQLVDGFRTLSQQFNRLPAESAPASVADGVTERLTPHELAESPRSPVRRWGWAAAAVAASLAIMVFSGAPEVGPIAKQTADAEQARVEFEAPAEADRVAAVAAADEPGAPTITAAPERRAMANESSAIAAAPAVPPRFAETPPASDAYALSAATATAAAPPATIDSPPQAFVRLELAPDAVRSGAFERVLFGNRIDVKETAPPRGVVSQLAAAGIRLTPVGAEARQSADKFRPAVESALTPDTGARGDATEPLGLSFIACNTGEVLPRSADEVEFVLVDAAAPVVERCLADFSGDTSNFRRVEVESTDTLQRGRRSLVDAANPTQQIQQRRVEPWFAYNRSGAEITKASPPGAAAARAGARAYGLSDALSKSKRHASPPGGRAYRFSTIDERRAGTAAAKAGPLAIDSLALPAARARHASDEFAAADQPAADRASDRVQVLFVLESSGPK